jgi:hypothetical protein
MELQPSIRNADTINKLVLFIILSFEIVLYQEGKRNDLTKAVLIIVRRKKKVPEPKSGKKF